jgi:hypothetical protein
MYFHPMIGGNTDSHKISRNEWIALVQNSGQREGQKKS